MLKGSDFSDGFGGYVAPDPIVRTISVNNTEYKIRKKESESGTPYMSAICFENQKIILSGDFLINLSDSNLVARIKEEIKNLEQQETNYQQDLCSDVLLLREKCRSVGIIVDEDLGGNFKYFLNKYLKAKGISRDFYSTKLNGDTYKINYNGASLSLQQFLKTVEDELNQPSFEELLQEFQQLLKKPQTQTTKVKITELRQKLYSVGSKPELKKANLI
ncbi:MAG: hypothetical protein ACKPEO_19110 [Sphaerospermopsis kisseleviana]